MTRLPHRTHQRRKRQIMRIVSGIARGRRLRAPKGRAVRPTADRVKEAVFSILECRDACTDVAVLDLFAGTGNLGIEALSRGAREAVFVDSSRSAGAAIRENLRAAGLQGEVMTMPVSRAMGRLGAAERRFGGVFLDPPYDRGWVHRSLVQLDEAGLVRPGGWVVVEHGREEEPSERIGTLRRSDQRRYGDTRIAFFTAAPAERGAHGED
jgi:16S rRNA (guanine(966)-N(2))-methyltransferase RsmD